MRKPQSTAGTLSLSFQLYVREDLPMQHTFERIAALWFLLNLAIPAFALYRRSPAMRHKLFRWTVGGSAPLHDRALVHALVGAAHAHR